MIGFLELPARSPKPRTDGVTSVLDRGLAISEVNGLMEVAGDSIDLVKLGWGTALVTGNLDAKLGCYREHGVAVTFGGTLTELVIRDGRIDEYTAWLKRLQIAHVEVSDGTIELDPERKREIIARFVADGFTVLSEVGSKDDTRIMAPYRWVELIQGELDAGAWKVIAEARESGTAGIYRADGEVRMGLIDELAHALPVDRLLFEAPQKDQQVWFLQRFGHEVNLGNIAPSDVLSLETLRLGLRSDTMRPGASEDAGS